MTVEFFNFSEQTPSNQKTITKLLYDAFETKFKPIFKKTTLEESLNILQQTFSKTSGFLSRDNDEIIGVAILSSANNSSLHLDKKAIRKIGLISFISFKYVFYVQKIKDNKTVKIELFAIKKGLRGNGIGSKILQEIIKYSKSEQYKKILLEVVDTNPKAKSLYKRLGFKTFKSNYSGILTKPFGFAGCDDMSLNISKKPQSI